MYQKSLSNLAVWCSNLTCSSLLLVSSFVLHLMWSYIVGNLLWTCRHIFSTLFCSTCNLFSNDSICNGGNTLFNISRRSCYIVSCTTSLMLYLVVEIISNLFYRSCSILNCTTIISMSTAIIGEFGDGNHL